MQGESTTGPFVRRGRVGQEDAFTREGRVGHEEDAFVQGWCAGHDKSTIKLSSGNPIATVTMTTVEEVAVAIDVNNAPHPIGWDGAVMTSKEEEEEEEGACEEGDDCDDAIAATRRLMAPSITTKPMPSSEGAVSATKTMSSFEGGASVTNQQSN